MKTKYAVTNMVKISQKVFRRNIIGKQLIPAALLVAMGFALPPLARADAVVTSCDEPSLQQAVNMGGLVTFDCTGIITLTRTIQVFVDTTISGTGHFISGGNSVPVFAVPAGVTLNLDHLHITNGKANLEGGGVINNGTLNVAHCAFSNNRAGKGGAISNHGTFTVGNTLFDHNTAFNEGGGAIYNDGMAEMNSVNNSEFDNNSGSGSSAQGGAIFNDNNGMLTVTNGIFSANTTTTNVGAGILNKGTLTVIDSALSGTLFEGVGRGSGISNLGGRLVVQGSTFSANRSTVVSVFATGALVNSGSGDAMGIATVTNSTFSGNTVGIWNEGTLTLDYSTLSGNSLINLHDQGTATLSNTILSKGTPRSAINCTFRSDHQLVDSGYNLDDDGTCGFSSANNSFSNRNPDLGSLADNGGPTKTIMPNPDSPVIDVTPPGTNGCGNPVDKDQRGIPRPQGTGCEIGSYEVSPLVPPSSSCNGDFVGNFIGDLQVGGTTCFYRGGSITGSLRVFDGGRLFLQYVTVGGDVEVNGGSVSIGPSTTINGNLLIHNLDSTSTGNKVCGANIMGNLAFHDNAAAIAIGANPLSVCAGNTIGGNLDVHNNIAPIQTLDNTVAGDLNVHNNTAPIQVVGNTVARDLSCHGNSSITGGPNPGSGRAQDQCFQTTRH